MCKGRCRAVPRRKLAPVTVFLAESQAQTADGLIEMGAVAGINVRPFIDFAAHQVTVRGEAVELSAGEYRLLVELATNAGRVLLQDELLGRVWGPDYIGSGALLQTAIRRLRRKIEADPSSPRHVLTKRGVGYHFAKN